MNTVSQTSKAGTPVRRKSALEKANSEAWRVRFSDKAMGLGSKIKREEFQRWKKSRITTVSGRIASCVGIAARYDCEQELLDNLSLKIGKRNARLIRQMIAAHRANINDSRAEKGLPPIKYKTDIVMPIHFQRASKR